MRLKYLGKKVMAVSLSVLMLSSVVPSGAAVFADPSNDSAETAQTEYVLNTSSRVENNAAPWTFGYYKVAEKKFYPSALTAYTTYDETGKKWFSDDFYTTGGISVASDANSNFVATANEPAVVFTAPKDGCIKVDWGVSAPGRKNEETDGSEDGIRYKVEKFSSDGNTMNEKIYPLNKEWRDLDRGYVSDEQTGYTYVTVGEKIQIRFNAMKTQWSDSFKFPKFNISYIDDEVVFEKSTKYLTYYSCAGNISNGMDNYQYLNHVDLSAKIIDGSAKIISYESGNADVLASDLSDDETINTTGKFVVKKQSVTSIDLKGDPVVVTCKYQTKSGEEKTVTQNVYTMTGELGLQYNNSKFYRWKDWGNSYAAQSWTNDGPVWYYGLAYPRGRAANEVEYGFDYHEFTGYGFTINGDYGRINICAPSPNQYENNRSNLSNSGDTVIAFKAPRTGNVEISFRDIEKAKGSSESGSIWAYGNDGLRFAIRKNNAKIYPTGDAEWQTVEKEVQTKIEPFNMYVKEGDYIYFVLNINKNNYSDTFNIDPTITYRDDSAYSNISFDKDKYMLTYCAQEWEAKETGYNNEAELSVTVPDSITDKMVRYETSDSSKLEWIGGNKFKVKAATGSENPITVTAYADNNRAQASTSVYTYEQTLTDSNNPECYPLYTVKTAAVQGPVWYVMKTLPMADSNPELSAVTYEPLNCEIRADGSTILRNDGDDYKNGSVFKNAAGTSNVGQQSDVTFAFKAPKSGKVHIGSALQFNRNLDNTSRDEKGFKYRISKSDNTAVYPSDGSWAFYSKKDSPDFYEGGDTFINKGEYIYITINNAGYLYCTNFYYIPSVTYIDEDSNPYNLDVKKDLALTNISSNGGVDNNDTLQRALNLDEPQASIKVTENGVESDDASYIADAESYSVPGEFKALPQTDNSATTDIKFSGNSAGKTLKNLDVAMQSKNKTSWQEESGLHYNLEFQYSTTANPTEFTTFYKTSSSEVPKSNTSYPLIRINDTEGKITDIDTIRIISNRKIGSSAYIGEIDLNTTEDSSEVSTAKAAKENELTVDGAYGDNMMFQQKKPIVITGKGGEGTVNVTLTKKGETKAIRNGSATGSKDGWKVSLDALVGGFDEYTLSVSDGNTTKTFNDVVIGELWLAAGQSNMAFWEYESTSFEDDKADADKYKIRYFSQDTVAAVDKRDDVCNGKWIIANTADSIRLAYAVGYSFAKNYYNLMDKKVPVGLVQIAQGSSGMQCFMPEELLGGDFSVLDNSKSVDPYQNSSDSPKWQTRATGLYNGMLNPINFNISGVIWYQAENNTSNCELFKKLEPTFIKMIREKFNDDKLPFILTQLPSYELGGDGWRDMRDVQMQNVLNDPYAGIAVTVDTGDRDNIHPKDKTKVGQRLALVAAGKFKGVDTEYSGPMLDGVKQNGDKLVLSFNCADGLKSSGTTLNGFEISADGTTYVSANAVIDGNKVTVSADLVTNPKYVRYAYAAYVEDPNLYNSADLPAAPFDASVNDYTDWTIDIADGKASVSNTVANTDSFVKGEKLIMAVYDSNNRLSNIKITPFEVIYKEGKTISESIDFGSDAKYVKVMQWKNSDEIIPVKTSQTKEK